MNTIVGEQPLQSRATLQSQQPNTIKSTGELSKPDQNSDNLKGAVTASTIVTLGAKQDAPVTYSKTLSSTKAPDTYETNLVGGIKKPPPQAELSLTNSLATATIDETENKVLGGVRRPPP